MGEPFYIRPSTVAGAMLCPARSGLRGSHRYQYYPNEGLFFGTLTHFGIEHLLVNGFTLDGIEQALMDAMPDLWQKDADDAPENFQRVELSSVMERGQRVAMVAEVVTALERWLQGPANTVLNDIIRYEVERTIQRVVGLYKVTQVIMRGTPDLITHSDSAIEIIDWKTAGKNWDKDKMSAQFQRIAYPWMFGAEEEKQVWFTYWIYDRSAQWWLSHAAPAIRYPHEIDALIDQTLAVAGSMIERTWTYSPTGQGWGGERGWHCSPKYCDAWNACSGRYLVRDDKVDLPAPTLKERMVK